jgi:hypothetical protein
MRTPNVSVVRIPVGVGVGVVKGDDVGVSAGEVDAVGVDVFVGLGDGEVLALGSKGMIPEKIREAKMTTIKTTAIVAAIRLVFLFLGCICDGGGGGGG